MALGARRQGVLSLMLGHGLKLALVGAALGLVLGRHQSLEWNSRAGEDRYPTQDLGVNVYRARHLGSNPEEQGCRAPQAVFA
jgi:hypothetical protein